MLVLASHPIFEAYRQSDLFGKIIFASLLFLSIVTWVIFIQKWRIQREIRQKGVEILETFHRMRSSPLTTDLGVYKHPFADLYKTLKQHTLELLGKNRSATSEKGPVFLSRSDIELIEAYLTTNVSQATKGLESNLFILSTVVTLAPFLGLLGTVWGILVTFAELQAGAASNASATVMGGLAMALGTTVLGLLVAIPALIAYNYLKSSVSQFSTEMEDFGSLLLASVELHYRKVDVS